MNANARKPYQFGLAGFMLAVVPLAAYFGMINWSHRHKAHMQEAVRWAEGFGGSGTVVDQGKFFEEHKIFLKLASTSVSDQDLVALEDQSNLSRLDLANTAITDDGLRLLYRMHQLEFINLTGTEVTPAGVRTLRREVPGLVVQQYRS